MEEKNNGKTSRYSIFWNNLNVDTLKRAFGSWDGFLEYMDKSLAVISSSVDRRRFMQEVDAKFADILPAESTQLIETSGQFFGYCKSFELGRDVRPLCRMTSNGPLANDYYELGNMLNARSDPDDTIAGALIAGPTSSNATDILNNGYGYRDTEGEWHQPIVQDKHKGAIAIFDPIDSGPHTMAFLDSSEAGLYARDPGSIRALIGTSLVFDFDGGDYTEQELWHLALEAADQNHYRGCYNQKFGMMIQQPTTHGMSFSYKLTSFAREMINQIVADGNTPDALKDDDMMDNEVVIAAYMTLANLNGSGIPVRAALMEMNSLSEPKAIGDYCIGGALKDTILPVPFSFFVPQK